jgi:predicted transcriptional regulator
MRIKRFPDLIDENIMEVLREKGSVCPGTIKTLAGHSWNAAKDGLDRLVFKGLVKQEIRFRQYRYTLTEKGKALEG